MVTISLESPVATEARLRAVFADCEVTWLPDRWHFVEGAEATRRDDGIALVRDEGRTSALCPDPPAGAEQLAVFRVVLPRGRDDSGFVGWLATRVKATTGSGLIVICGHDAERGGVFDYYGVPADVAPRVRAQLEAMADPSRLASQVLRPVRTSAESRVDPATAFCFETDGTSLSARYGGGRVEEGWLTGTVVDGRCELAYLQRLTSGVVEHGRSTGELSRLEDGRWRLVEHYRSVPDGRTGTNVLEGAPTAEGSA